ncbi:MAG: T9SS type A sorting domain-containing protein [Rhodothermia bacterium]
MLAEVRAENLVEIFFPAPESTESNWFEWFAGDGDDAFVGRSIEAGSATEVWYAQPNFSEGSFEFANPVILAEKEKWEFTVAGDVNNAGLLCVAVQLSTDGNLEGSRIDVFQGLPGPPNSDPVTDLSLTGSIPGENLLVVDNLVCDLYGGTMTGGGVTGFPGAINVSIDPTGLSLDGFVIKADFLQGAEFYNAADGLTDVELTTLLQANPMGFNSTLDAGEATGFRGFDGPLSWKTGSSSGEIEGPPGTLTQVFFTPSGPETIDVGRAPDDWAVFTNLRSGAILLEFLSVDGFVVTESQIAPLAGSPIHLEPEWTHFRASDNSTGDQEVVQIDGSDDLIGESGFRYVLHPGGYFGAAAKQTSQALGITAFDIRGNPVDLKIVTATEESGQIPEPVALRDNYPNPFAETTEIPYSLSASMHVKLEVYTLLGRRVATLVDGMKTAGSYSAEWDGMLVDGRRAPAGIYLYRLSDGNGGMIGGGRSMTLLR